MPLISVLTPVHERTARFLPETAESVLGQSLPKAWELEWVIQEDGVESDAVRERLPADQRISYAATGSGVGPAAARNLGLARVGGVLLQNLDADDLLLPGALLRHISSLEGQKDVHWAVGQADDLMPDGSRVAFPPDLQFGRIEPRHVNEWAVRHDGNWPIHCAGVMYRTASVRALGGWGGVPFDDDIVLFAALSELTAGWFDEATTWLYRQHPGQSIRTPLKDQWGEVGRRIALQRVRALSFAGLSLIGTQPDPSPDVTVGAAHKVTQAI